MKIFTKAFLIAAVISIMAAGSAFAENEVPYDVNIEQSGCDVTITWTAPDFDGIDKYQVQLVKEKTNTDTNYKSVTVSSEDTSVDMTIGAKGYYHARVRMRDVNNKWHAWSSSSTSITVTSEDIGSGGSGSGSFNIVGPGVTPYTSNTPASSITSNTTGLSPATGNAYSTSSSTVTSKKVAAFTYSSLGWQFEQAGMWYLNMDGTYPVSTWKAIDGHYYHFNNQGYLEVNTWVLENDGWRYVGANAIMAQGWNYINNKWYYFNPASGKLEGPGLIIVDNRYYYIGTDGARVENGWVDGNYFGADGALTYGQ